ncbi:hypothetical protein ABB27_10775 [Stenotrophomonas terrae]|uniref:Uncharacterized protein n=1 Tax=Stenotrophomonas terrae TaxID=405446 RepID=A0A0R0CDP6_9GAMM|nr:hypothetical protein ABB27_10775 [Stenotrophomonas terrae]
MTEKVASGLRPVLFLWTAKSLPKLLICNLKCFHSLHKEDFLPGQKWDSNERFGNFSSDIAQDISDQTCQ